MSSNVYCVLTCNILQPAYFANDVIASDLPPWHLNLIKSGYNFTPVHILLCVFVVRSVDGAGESSHLGRTLCFLGLRTGRPLLLSESSDCVSVY